MENSTKQKLISAPIQVFSKGHFKASGYSTHMNFVYDKRAAKSGKLREWDFYQILCGNTVLQFSVGHFTRVGQISLSMLDISTGEKRVFAKTIYRVGKLRKILPANPEKTYTMQWFGPGVKMQVEVASRYRRITLSQFKDGDIRVELDVTLTHASAEKEKMVIAVPFEDPKNWYLNYKENCFVANGYCRIGNTEAQIEDGAAVFDWSRGVLPKKVEWVWGNGSTTVDGTSFGFNIGWGFGNSSTTQNMFFYDDKAIKLGEVTETKTDGGYLYADDEKNFVFEVKPIFDNFTQSRGIFAKSSAHQIFGVWHGLARLPDGTKLKVPPFTAFCEHAEQQ